MMVNDRKELGIGAAQENRTFRLWTHRHHSRLVERKVMRSVQSLTVLS